MNALVCTIVCTNNKDANVQFKDLVAGDDGNVPML